MKTASSPAPDSSDSTLESDDTGTSLLTPPEARNRTAHAAGRPRIRRSAPSGATASITTIVIRRPDLARPLPALPTPLTTFIGRDEVISLVTGILRPAPDRTPSEEPYPTAVRLLTLTGPGGVGKSRLAIHLAGILGPDYPGGVGFVALTAIRDPALVLPTIAQALGARQDDRRSPVQAIQAALLGRRCLLVIDNFEQVVAASLDIAALLAACPDLTLLVTSRTPLHLNGEREVPIPPLSLDPGSPSRRSDDGDADQPTEPGSEAVRLFIARAKAARADLSLDENSADVITEICARLDGLPLAIELAAGQIRIFPPSALLARLRSRLPILEVGLRDAPARQRTMRNTIAWSYDLLTPDEQAFFRRLSVFAGGFSIEAASVVAGEGDKPDGLRGGRAFGPGGFGGWGVGEHVFRPLPLCPSKGQLCPAQPARAVPLDPQRDAGSGRAQPRPVGNRRRR